jgi:hypothetical protein
MRVARELGRPRKEWSGWADSRYLLDFDAVHDAGPFGS